MRHFDSLTDVREYVARKRQEALVQKEKLADPDYKVASQKERQIQSATAIARWSALDDVWDALGEIHVSVAYRGDRVPENVCLVCGEEQPARTPYCNADITLDGIERCDHEATWKITHDDPTARIDVSLVCNAHLGPVLAIEKGSVEPLDS